MAVSERAEYGNAAIAEGDRACTGSYAYAYNITSGTLTTGTTAVNGLTANSGTSRIIIDNMATIPAGASQIDFSTLTNGGSCTTSGDNGGCAIQA